MTHAELVARAARWLRGTAGCPIVFAEMVTYCGEQPDAIGFRDRGLGTYLIECKATRSDFLADRHKAHRHAPRAIGLHRYYMSPPNLIGADEVPAGWGLLYAHASKVELVKGKRPKCWRHEPDFACSPHRENELGVLFSALSRLRIHLGASEFDRIVGMTYTKRLEELGQPCLAEGPSQP